MRTIIVTLVMTLALPPAAQAYLIYAAISPLQPVSTEPVIVEVTGGFFIPAGNCVCIFLDFLAQIPRSEAERQNRGRESDVHQAV